MHGLLAARRRTFGGSNAIGADCTSGLAERGMPVWEREISDWGLRDWKACMKTLGSAPRSALDPQFHVKRSVSTCDFPVSRETPQFEKAGKPSNQFHVEPRLYAVPATQALPSFQRIDHQSAEQLGIEIGALGRHPLAAG